MNRRDALVKMGAALAAFSLLPEVKAEEFSLKSKIKENRVHWQQCKLEHAQDIMKRLSNDADNGNIKGYYGYYQYGVATIYWW